MTTSIALETVTTDQLALGDVVYHLGMILEIDRPVQAYRPDEYRQRRPVFHTLAHIANWGAVLAMTEQGGINAARLIVSQARNSRRWTIQGTAAETWQRVP